MKTLAEMRDRLVAIEREYKTAKAYSLAYYDDLVEVHHWYAVMDELVLEREQITQKIQEHEDLAMEWAIRIATHTDREM